MLEGKVTHNSLTGTHKNTSTHARARARAHTTHTRTHAHTHTHKHTHKLHTHTNTCTHLLCPHNGHQTERPAAADCGEYGQAHVVWYSVDHRPLGHRLIHLKHTSVDHPIIMTGTVQWWQSSHDWNSTVLTIISWLKQYSADNHIMTETVQFWQSLHD